MKDLIHIPMGSMMNNVSYLEDVNKVLAYSEDSLRLLQNYLKGDELKAIIDAIVSTRGRVVFSGIGKSGHIAKRASSIFSSIGTCSYFIHPSEAAHGDLGMIHAEDFVVLISNSGQTNELLPIAEYCNNHEIKTALITSNSSSLLANIVSYILTIPEINEYSSVPVPTVSSMLTIALCDAIMIVIHNINQFSHKEYKNLHPGGSIGVKMLRVEHIMHKNPPACSKTCYMKDVIVTITKGALGCCIVCDAGGSLIGIITDGDLRRAMSDDLLQKTASDVMSVNCKTVSKHIPISDAVILMRDYKITSLVVVDDRSPIGIVHIHDIIRVKGV